MIATLNYQQLQKILLEVKPLLIGSICKAAIAAGSRKFVLTFHDKLCDHYLLLCFQEPFLRFHLTERKWKPLPNIPFAVALAAKLIGLRLTACALLNGDRILELSFEGKNQSIRLVAEFLSKRPNAYLLDEGGGILASLNPAAKAVYTLPPKPHRYHRDELIDERTGAFDSRKADLLYAGLEAESDYLKSRRIVEAQVEKQLKTAQKRLTERENALKHCRAWPQVQHEGELIQANLFRIRAGMREIDVFDWQKNGQESRILLDPSLKAHEQAAGLFKKSKKLRSGEKHAERMLENAKEDVQRCLKQFQEFQQVHAVDELERYAQLYGFRTSEAPAKTPVRKAAPKPYDLFNSETGVEIWVGRNAKCNDQLTFRCAKGSDWWMHARDYAGSHVILRCGKGKEPDTSTLNDAAELALRYSKGKSQGKGEISLSQVKWLSRIKSAPGKVMLSKHKIVFVEMDEKRWERLKKTKNHG